MKISYKRWSGIPYVLYIGNHKLWKTKMIYVLDMTTLSSSNIDKNMHDQNNFIKNILFFSFYAPLWILILYSLWKIEFVFASKN